MRSRLVCFVLFTSFPTSIFGAENAQFSIDNPRGRDLLGYAVSLWNDKAFLGAPAGQFKQGIGYLFDTNSGSFQELIPSVPVEDDLFAFVGDLSEDHLVIGDPANPFRTAPLEGSAYVFDPITGVEVHRLLADDGFDGNEFGFSTAVDAELLLIGSPALGQQKGSVYVFNPSNGTQIHKLVSSSSRNGDEFGWDVEVDADANLAIVGSPGNFQTLGLVAGHAYLFDPTNGNQLQTLTPNESTPGDEFGYSVAVEGNFALIGAPDAGVGEGTAYVFDASTGQQLHRLVASDSEVHNDFGSTVDIFGNLGVVGGGGQDGVMGRAYVFDLTTGQEIIKLLPERFNISDSFGTSVSIFDKNVLVGAPRHDDGGVNTGTAYLFELDATVPGDFNDDGVLTVADIDLLTDQVKLAEYAADFDLNDDGLVDRTDRRVWVEELANSFLGDSNLDGEFNSDDLIKVFVAGEYEDDVHHNSTWADGDWNGDCEFGTDDIIAVFQSGSYEKGPRTLPAVPGPASGILLLGWVSLLTNRRRPKSSISQSLVNP